MRQPAVWRIRRVTGEHVGVSQAYPLMAFRQQAEALANAGDLGEARALLEDVVADARGKLGEDDPDLLATAHHLAILHRRADDPTAARRVLEEAYAAGQWRLGDADPLMLEISFDLGMVAAELGNRHEARKALARVADTGASVLGEDHWAVQQARDYLDKDPSTVRVDDSPGLAGDVYPTIPAQRAPTGLTAAESPAPTAPRTGPEGEPAGETVRPAEEPGWQTAEPDGRAEWETDTPTGRLDWDTAGPGGRVAGEGDDDQGWDAAAGGHGTVPEPVDEAGAAGHGTDGPAYQKRGSTIFAAVAAGVAVIVAVAALIFALGGNQSNTKDNVPTLAGDPPGDVRLIDLGASIRLTWQDPAAGKVTFLVTGGHPGDHLLRPMGQTGLGQTSYELQGLSTELDYCFAVVAVYGSSAFASSPQVCTSRVRPSRTQ